MSKQLEEFNTHKIICGNCLDIIKTFPNESVDCVITSPPYYQLRNYGWEGQWGLEPTYQEYLDKMVELMKELKRVLKTEGTMWINLGDSYSGSNGNGYKQTLRKDNSPYSSNESYSLNNLTKRKDTVQNKSLMLIPHRFAIRCIDELELILRNDIIWAKCLSGGTKLYAKTSKGTFPQPVKDLARLNNVELWTGKKWSKVRGFYENKDYKNPLEIELRSGEKIACTREHRFPTQRGLVRADELKIGDKLIRTTLPDNDTKNNIINNKLVAWFVGLYLAEGSRSDKVIQIASHSNEKERYEKCKKVASLFDGTCNKYDTSNNGSTINLSGIMLNAIIDKFIAGRTAKDKHLSTDAWQQRNDFLRTLLLSYLDADAHFDKPNDRYRLGFTDNIQLVNDLRTICARLGYDIRVKRHIFKIKDKEYPGYRGQIRFSASEHSNEIVKIGKSNGRKFWDIEIEDEPHLFALASGILTHNSNGMPESVTDRFSKKHEFIFFFVKQAKYYFDLDSIREKHKDISLKRIKYGFKSNHDSIGQIDVKKMGDRFANPKGKNPGDVSDFWDILTKPNKEKHYATYNNQLIDKPIIAGCPEGGIILDPFCGIGTTLVRAIELNRKAIGIDGKEEYCKIAKSKIEKALEQIRLI